MAAPNNYTLAELDGMKKMREGGAPWRTIADSFGSTDSAIVLAAKRHGFWSDDIRKFVPTPDELEAMRAMRLGGASFDAISKVYGVGPKTIARISEQNDFRIAPVNSRRGHPKKWAVEVETEMERLVVKTDLSYEDVAARLRLLFGIQIGRNQVVMAAKRNGMEREKFVARRVMTQDVIAQRLYTKSWTRWAHGKPEDNRVRHVPPGTHAAPAGGYRMGMV